MRLSLGVPGWLRGRIKAGRLRLISDVQGRVLRLDGCPGQYGPVLGPSSGAVLGAVNHNIRGSGEDLHLTYCLGVIECGKWRF